MSNSVIKNAIYLAAPLFNDMERSFNLRLSVLMSQWSEVFLPQRDGRLLRDLTAECVPLEVARNIVFESDLTAIRRCNILVAVLDGRTIDEGVAFEIGFARALNKTCFGLKTDDRVLLASGDNPMILAGCNQIFGSIDMLLEKIKELRI